MEISVYEDRSFTFELKTPPAAKLLLAAVLVPGAWRFTGRATEARG